MTIPQDPSPSPRAPVLLPCPFCGASLINHPDTLTDGAKMHPPVRCFLQLQEVYPTLDFDNWNRRAPASEEARELVRENIEDVRAAIPPDD